MGRPSETVDLPERWWETLRNYCQNCGFARTTAEIYKKIGVDRKTIERVRKDNQCTEYVLDMMASALPCKTTDELRKILWVDTGIVSEFSKLERSRGDKSEELREAPPKIEPVKESPVLKPETSRAGQGRKLEQIRGIALLRTAAEGGNVEAQGNLGRRYFFGLYQKQDYDKAVEWFRKAADQGDACSQYRLGMCYFYGKGVKQDYIEAVEWHRKASDRGDVNSQYFLAKSYLYGIGVKQNDVKGMKLLRKAAESHLSRVPTSGDAEAQWDLGWRYFHGTGVRKNIVKAVDLFHRAAKGGIGHAQYALGCFYFEGIAVSPDYGKAFDWFCQAAKHKIADAYYAVGICYAVGRGIPRNDAQAARWIRKSAESGEPRAQYILGICYALGKGIVFTLSYFGSIDSKDSQNFRKDYVMAHKWLNLAIAQGFERAKEKLVILEKKMTRAQISKAQRLAANSGGNKRVGRR